MKNIAGHLFPETAMDIDAVYTSRQELASHPQGKFDRAGRWYPSEDEIASCCAHVRSPSRAHPYSYLVHCRTKKHIQAWYMEHVAKIGEGIGLGVGFGVWVGPQFFDRPTIAQLKAARAECVMFALAMHRRILRTHPSDTSVIDWEHARRYWTQQAYHAHGEIMAQLEAMPIINRICATAPMSLPC